MSRETNLAAVDEMYAAFGRGEIAGVLSHLDSDVEWCNRGPTEFEYFGVKQGHDGALAIFGFLADNVDITVFDPHTMIADQNHVVALVRVVGTVKDTGMSYDEETVHVFDLDADARVVRFRDYQDTDAVAKALRG